jgi:hypothetical protein
MGRSAASVVSALSGFGANGRQTVHHVSSPLPKIPYGGFSPVRLQTELLPRPSRLAFADPLIRGRSRWGPGIWWRPSVEASGRPHRPPAQRPLARRRVMLSRQVIAYYDLIRGPAALPPISFSLYGGSLPAAKPQRFPAFLCVSFRPCRLPYPAGRRGFATVPIPSALAFAQHRQARHPALSTQPVSAWSTLSGLQSSLHAAARAVASPAPVRTFTSELSSHESPL